MIGAVKTWLAGTVLTRRRHGRAGGGALSLPSFLLGAASAAGICWLAQAGGPPPPAAIVLLSIAVLSTGWLAAALGAPADLASSHQNDARDIPPAEGDLPDPPRSPVRPTVPVRCLSTGPMPDGHPLGQRPAEDGLDRLRDGCGALERKAGLSPREREVLELLARGRNTRYIQDALVISGSTVKSHTYRIYRKLGVHSRQDLIDEVEAAQTGDGRGITETGGGKVLAFRTDRRGKRDGSARQRRYAQR